MDLFFLSYSVLPTPAV